MAAATDAFSRHDAKAWAKLCTPDAQLVTVRGEFLSGIAEIEERLTGIFRTRGRNVTLKTLGMTVRFILPEVALAHVTNELSGRISPGGRTLPPRVAHHRVSQHDCAEVMTMDAPPAPYYSGALWKKHP